MNIGVFAAEQQEVPNAQPAADGGLGDEVWGYFMLLWPVMISLGFGGGVLGLVYNLIDYYTGVIKRKMYCSITLKYNDDTYKWVQKYMKETGKLADVGT